MMIYGYNMVLVAGIKQTTQHNILYLLGNYEHIRAIYLNILYNVYVYLQENIAKLLTIVYNLLLTIINKMSKNIERNA